MVDLFTARNRRAEKRASKKRRLHEYFMVGKIPEQSEIQGK